MYRFGGRKEGVKREWRMSTGSQTAKHCITLISSSVLLSWGEEVNVEINMPITNTDIKVQEISNQ